MTARSGGLVRSRVWGDGLAAAAASLCLALWLGRIATGSPPLPGSALAGLHAAAVVALAAGVALGAAARAALAFARGGAARRRALALAALLAAAVVVRLVGLDHELIDRPYLDEGTYRHHALEILSGEPWSASFVYPPLVYYADAFALWAVEPFREPLARFVGGLLGADHPAAVDAVAFDWLVLRLLVALAGAFTVWPVFRVAEVVAAGRPEPGSAFRDEGSRDGGSLDGGSRHGGPILGNGLAAAVLGGLLITVAPLYNEVSHLNISDLPSAFFAALCLAACARLLLRESLAGYGAAGAASGLAAACKYPAGVVAVAVVAVWLHHRWEARRGRLRRGGARPETAGHQDRAPQPARGGPWATTFGLFTAGASSLAVFLAATPSLFVFPRQAVSGGRGIFFGVRQYGAGGWIGVQPDSNALYYGRLIGEELGWPAVLVALAGLAGLAASAGGRRVLRRLAWLAPFPAAYLLLMVSMNMVVRRNLLPAVPPLCAFAGVGVVAAWALAQRAWARRRPADGTAGRRVGGRWFPPVAAVALTALLLQPPAAHSLADSVAMARPSTRELARAWLLASVPPGSAVVRESYGPELPAERYAVWKSRFAARFPLDDLRAEKVDYLVLASAAYLRFLDEGHHREAHHATYAAWYREVFDEVPEVARFEPGRLTWGPLVRVHRLDAAPRPAAAAPTVVRAADLFLPDGGMRDRGASGQGSVGWFLPGQWALAKADLAPGEWQVTVRGGIDTAGDGAAVEVWRHDGPQARSPLRPLPEAGGVGRATARVSWTAPGRAYLYLRLPVGSWVEAVRFSPVSAARSDGVAGTGIAPPQEARPPSDAIPDTP